MMEADPVKITDPSSWFWLLFMSLLLFGVLFTILSFVNISEISQNWPAHRCNPLIIPFSSLFGYNTSENFNFCVSKILKTGSVKFTGPFSSILQILIGSLSTIISSVNSFRLILATLMGGITTIFKEMAERFTLLMSHITLVSSGLKRLMGRMFATFYAIIYMGTSGIQAGTNFSNTFLFSFIDTFCFSPDTQLYVKNVGMVDIQDIAIGDILKNGERVTAVYRVMADGQKMVSLPSSTDIIVSSNHFVKYNSSWIRAGDHPFAKPLSPWAGGSEKPLICLDTDIHEIPIGDYTFSDYMELDSTDAATMKLIEETLNNTDVSPLSDISYSPGLEIHENVIMKDGSKKMIRYVSLGDEVSTGTVYGIVERKTDKMYLYKSTIIHGSTLVWTDSKWSRVHGVPDATELFNIYDTIHLLVMRTGTVETPNLVCRDFMEVHSPDIEKITEEALINPKS